MPYRTLQDLRTELRVRLGFGAAGGVPGTNQPLLDSFLRTAQTELYWQGSWAELRGREDISIGTGQTLVDYPVDANPQRIEDIWVLVNTTWMRVIEGIDKSLYTTVSNRSYPAFYERLGQLEFWPEADQAYTIRVWYFIPLARFTQDADRATLNDDLVLARALAIGKAHYRHPDADVSNATVSAMMDGVKGGAWRQKSFSRKHQNDIPLVKPRTV